MSRLIYQEFSGVPDGATRLNTRSVGWNRTGWELNTLDGLLAGTFLNIYFAAIFFIKTLVLAGKNGSFVFPAYQARKKSSLTFRSNIVFTNEI